MIKLANFSRSNLQKYERLNQSLNFMFLVNEVWEGFYIWLIEICVYYSDFCEKERSGARSSFRS